MKTLLIVAWLSGVGADATSTHLALKQGARETVLSQNVHLNDAIFAGEAVGGSVGLLKLYRTHPKLAVGLAVVSSAFRGTVAVRNAQAGRMSR